MRISAIFLSLALVAAMSTRVSAATWEPVAEAKGERVDIDKSSILRTAAGKTTAWTRLQLGREVTEGGVSYSTVEALNRYDCTTRRYATVKRVYLRSDKAVREETVASPKEISIQDGSVDDLLMTMACKARTVGEAHQVAEAAALAAASASAAKPAPVADAGQPEAKGGAESAPAEVKPEKRPRFFELPAIDKSKVEDPYAGMTPEQKAAAQSAGAGPEKTAPKPAEKPAAKPAEKPVAKQAEKPAATPAARREIERQYATSGPRQQKAEAARKPSAASPAPDFANIAWSYEGVGGPADWAKLRPDYAICAGGRHQSPIDIRDGVRVDLEPIQFDYKLSQVRVVDNGHAIRAEVGEGSSITVTGHSYRLLRLEFHRPAEEQVNGRGYDMDIQFVHQDDAGNTAIVVVLLDAVGPENAQIQTLLNNLPLEVNRDVTPTAPIELKTLLPDKRAYYTYMGSLTTPPCTEEVLWMVLKQPVPISPEQVAIFSHLYKNNARPIQPSYGRLIKESR